jgi:PPP family 3-phenylpropionic acid transporter
MSAAFPRFVVTYALMYAAFGVASPFWPAFFASRGLAPEQLGILFATGTAVRLLSGPVAGRWADRLQALRAMLACCLLAAAGVALGLVPAQGFWLLLFVSVSHAAALAPVTTLADALALRAAGDPHKGRFEYGWVRGTGSGAFIVGTLMAGQVVAAVGLSPIVPLHVGLLAGAAAAALLLPALARHTKDEEARALPSGGIGALLRVPLFRRLMLVAALVMGSHAMHDGFAVIRWSAGGIGPATASALWSEAVAAEVLVFFLVGPALVKSLGPAGTAALAACAGVVRWVVMANTTDVIALALVQPLHGVTFAALHLACMRLIAGIVPPHLAATAQALYAFSVGATTALLTLSSGWFYGALGARGFLVMALLCAAALPLSRGLRARRDSSARQAALKKTSPPAVMPDDHGQGIQDRQTKHPRHLGR